MAGYCCSRGRARTWRTPSRRSELLPWRGCPPTRVSTGRGDGVRAECAPAPPTPICARPAVRAEKPNVGHAAPLCTARPPRHRIPYQPRRSARRSPAAARGVGARPQSAFDPGLAGQAARGGAACPRRLVDDDLPLTHETLDAAGPGQGRHRCEPLWSTSGSFRHAMSPWQACSPGWSARSRRYRHNTAAPCTSTRNGPSCDGPDGGRSGALHAGQRGRGTHCHSLHCRVSHLAGPPRPTAGLPDSSRHRHVAVSAPGSPPGPAVPAVGLTSVVSPGTSRSATVPAMNPTAGGASPSTERTCGAVCMTRPCPSMCG